MFVTGDVHLGIRGKREEQRALPVHGVREHPRASADGRLAWGVLAVEAFAIFLSVLLGFSVSARRDGRRVGLDRPPRVSAAAFRRPPDEGRPQMDLFAAP